MKTTTLAFILFFSLLLQCIKKKEISSKNQSINNDFGNKDVLLDTLIEGKKLKIYFLSKIIYVKHDKNIDSLNLSNIQLSAKKWLGMMIFQKDKEVGANTSIVFMDGNSLLLSLKDDSESGGLLICLSKNGKNSWVFPKEHNYIWQKDWLFLIDKSRQKIISIGAIEIDTKTEIEEESVLTPLLVYKISSNGFKLIEEVKIKKSFDFTEKSAYKDLFESYLMNP